MKKKHCAFLAYFWNCDKEKTLKTWCYRFLFALGHVCFSLVRLSFYIRFTTPGNLNRAEYKWFYPPTLVWNHTRIYHMYHVCTVWPKYNVPNFQMKSFRLFFRWNFLKICMEVPMISNIIYMKPKNSPQMATLIYKHFGNPGRCYPRARYTIVHKKAWRGLSFLPFIVNSASKALKCRSRQPRTSRGCQPPRTSRGEFFWLYIYNI